MADNNRSIRRNRRAYILDSEFLPVYVGEDVGDLDFEDAIDLSIIHRTNRGLPADKDFIMAFVPFQERVRETSRKSRASKNNPYVCPYCKYKATRYGNMVRHLRKVHGDYSTDPRHKQLTIHRYNPKLTTRLRSDLNRVSTSNRLTASRS